MLDSQVRIPGHTKLAGIESGTLLLQNSPEAEM
jgi:hypothetical protein